MLEWNKEQLVLFAIRASGSVELEIADFVTVEKLVKKIFIYILLKKSSSLFHLSLFLIYVDLHESKFNLVTMDIKKLINLICNEWTFIIGNV